MNRIREKSLRAALSALKLSPKVERALMAIWKEVDEHYLMLYKDLQARLSAIRSLDDKTHGDGGEYIRSKAYGKAIRRITNLKDKDWRR